MNDCFFILLSQAFFRPLLNFINPSALFKSFKRNSLKKAIKSGNASHTTQEDTHLLFEKSEFDPSFAYAELASLIFTAFFFQPILPIGAITSFIGLALTYYAYKKKLVKDSKKPVMVSDDIAEVTLYLLNCAPFVYGVMLYLSSYPRLSLIRY